MEGPYRDLGAGFARLTGVEGARRGPSRIAHVEDALLELLRNAREAGASRIYVASTLKERRFRTLTVIDDGHGIPESLQGFDPTTRRYLPPPRSRHCPRRPCHPRRRPLPVPDPEQLPTDQGPLRILAYLHTGHLRYRSPPGTRPPIVHPTLQEQPPRHPRTLYRNEQRPEHNAPLLLRSTAPYPRHALTSPHNTTE